MPVFVLKDVSLHICETKSSTYCKACDDSARDTAELLDLFSLV